MNIKEKSKKQFIEIYSQNVEFPFYVFNKPYKKIYFLSFGFFGIFKPDALFFKKLSMFVQEESEQSEYIFLECMDEEFVGEAISSYTFHCDEDPAVFYAKLKEQKKSRFWEGTSIDTYTFCSKIAVFSESMKWAMYADRNSELCVLAIFEENQSLNDMVEKKFEGHFYDVKTVIDVAKVALNKEALKVFENSYLKK